MLVPVQLSPGSHRPKKLNALHALIDGENGFEGHDALAPLQFAFSSQDVEFALQKVPVGLNASVGHDMLLPVQFSATSHNPADALHSVVAGTYVFAGQVALPVHVALFSQIPTLALQMNPNGLKASAGHGEAEPVQFSATSHAPAEDLHSVAAGLNVFAGHEAVPIQVALFSQVPALRLQTVPTGMNTSVGHVALAPVQFSGVSHTPADALHSVVAGTYVFAGQVALPVHVALFSQVPALRLQTVPIDLNKSVGHDMLLPVQFSAMSHNPADALQTVVDAL